MPEQPIIVERLLDAGEEKVWSAITSKEEMDKWYFKMDGFEARPGFKFSFQGEGRNGEKYIHLCELREVDPMKRLSYSWRYENMPGDSMVSFRLSPEGDKTKLVLTHTGVESFRSGNPDFSKESFTAGWTHIIGTALPAYLEQNK